MDTALDSVSLKSQINIPVATMMYVILGKEDDQYIHNIHVTVFMPVIYLVKNIIKTLIQVVEV